MPTLSTGRPYGYGHWLGDSLRNQVQTDRNRNQYNFNRRSSAAFSNAFTPENQEILRRNLVNRGLSDVRGIFDEGEGGGFGDEFYRDASQSQLDYALPQVQEQYDTARSDIISALSRRGLSSSSVMNRYLAQLEGKRTDTIDQTRALAEDRENNLRSAVENARGDLESQVYASAGSGSPFDPSIATNRAASIGAPAPIEFIGPIFDSVMGGLQSYYTPIVQQNTRWGRPAFQGGFGSSPSVVR
jgi:hypothetical protein